MAQKAQALIDARKAGDYKTATKLMNEITQPGIKELKDSLKGIAEVDAKPSISNYFQTPEATIVFNAKMLAENEPMFIEKVAALGSKWKQDTTHIHESVPLASIPKKSFGIPDATGYAYESGVEVSFTKPLTEAQKDLISERTKDIFPGMTFTSDGKGMFLYNVSKFSSFEQFRSDISRIRT